MEMIAALNTMVKQEEGEDGEEEGEEEEVVVVLKEDHPKTSKWDVQVREDRRGADRDRDREMDLLINLLLNALILLCSQIFDLWSLILVFDLS